MSEKEEKKTTKAKKEETTTAKKPAVKKAAPKKTAEKADKKEVVKKTAPKKAAPKKKEAEASVAVKQEKAKAKTVVSKKKNNKEISFSIEGKKYFYAVGKRKSAVARVRLYEKGTGKIEINGRDIRDYFFGILAQNAVNPMKLTENQKNFDVTVKVLGGGVAAQSDAARHGIARALVEADPALRSILKKAGYLTRDARVKERKKPGLKRARRSPQWAKR